jgi:hypothetical protein
LIESHERTHWLPYQRQTSTKVRKGKSEAPPSTLNHPPVGLPDPPGLKATQWLTRPRLPLVNSTDLQVLTNRQVYKTSLAHMQQVLKSCRGTTSASPGRPRLSSGGAKQQGSTSVPPSQNRKVHHLHSRQRAYQVRWAMPHQPYCQTRPPPDRSLQFLSRHSPQQTYQVSSLCSAGALHQPRLGDPGYHPVGQSNRAPQACPPHRTGRHTTFTRVSGPTWATPHQPYCQTRPPPDRSLQFLSRLAASLAVVLENLQHRHVPFACMHTCTHTRMQLMHTRTNARMQECAHFSIVCISTTNTARHYNSLATTVHAPGSTNIQPDALSRLPALSPTTSPQALQEVPHLQPLPRDGTLWLTQGPERRKVQFPQRLVAEGVSATASTPPQQSTKDSQKARRIKGFGHCATQSGQKGSSQKGFRPLHDATSTKARRRKGFGPCPTHPQPAT